MPPWQSATNALLAFGPQRQPLQSVLRYRLAPWPSVRHWLPRASQSAMRQSLG